jgi:hypothetical protein
VSIWHGGADATVKASNAVESEKQWVSAHGLSSTPSRTEALDGRRRSLWLSPATGEVLVESHLIPGMGHGAPLSTRGPDGLGAVAPFMLEAGVSSSLEIARFWGIAQPEAEVRTKAEPSPSMGEPSDPVRPAKTRESLVDQVLSSVGRHVSAEVKDVIARALKAAGLGG